MSCWFGLLKKQLGPVVLPVLRNHSGCSQQHIGLKVFTSGMAGESNMNELGEKKVELAKESNFGMLAFRTAESITGNFIPLRSR